MAAEVTVESAEAVTGPYTTLTAATIDTAAKKATTPIPSGNRFYRLKAGSALTLKQAQVQGANLVLTLAVISDGAIDPLVKVVSRWAVFR